MSSPERSHLVLLGTSGGPWPNPRRSGTSQAVVIGDRAYLVDCGYGVARQLVRAKLLTRLEEIFITHLHSDHVCDFFNLLLLGWATLQDRTVHAYGPGPAGGHLALPADLRGMDPAPLVNPTDPTPGLAAMTSYQFQAHAYDVNVRLRDRVGRRDLRELLAVHEIAIPPFIAASGPGDVAPPMHPIVVREDDWLRVSAILVSHAPVFPSFAFRFDTEEGSIVISGDTAPCANLIRLAKGADILVHEVLETRERRRLFEADPSGNESFHHLLTSHTSVDDVGKVATEAEVKVLVLTHFVEEDERLPDDHWLDAVGRSFAGKVVVGHDLMVIPL